MLYNLAKPEFDLEPPKNFLASNLQFLDFDLKIGIRETWLVQLGTGPKMQLRTCTFCFCKTNLRNVGAICYFFQKSENWFFKKIISQNKNQNLAFANFIVPIVPPIISKLCVKIFCPSSQRHRRTSNFCKTPKNEPKWKNGSNCPLGLSRLNFFG